MFELTAGCDLICLLFGVYWLLWFAGCGCWFVMCYVFVVLQLRGLGFSLFNLIAVWV